MQCSQHCSHDGRGFYFKITSSNPLKPACQYCEKPVSFITSHRMSLRDLQISRKFNSLTVSFFSVPNWFSNIQQLLQNMFDDFAKLLTQYDATECRNPRLAPFYMQQSLLTHKITKKFFWTTQWVTEQGICAIQSFPPFVGWLSLSDQQPF